MPLVKRHLILGVIIVTSLTVAVLMLRLGLEWRQALDDINAMIVTPIALPSPTGPDTPNTTASLDLDMGSPSAAQTAVALASPHLMPTPQSPTSSGGAVTILLMGTDARPKDTDPTRTDAMVLLHLNRATGKVSMLSLPRDLWVKYPNYGEGRINAAYAIGERDIGPGGGAALAKASVGRLLGLKVDYFVLLNFQGFRTLIDRLGGISVDVPQALDDPAYPTDDYRTIKVHFDAGPQWMNGNRALIYARTRHADNDFGRNQRQQQVLMAIFDRVRERGLLQQLTSIDDYTGALRDYVRTDMPQAVMLDLANWGRGLQSEDVQRYAIDSKMVFELRGPATFAVDPKELKRVVGQLTGKAVDAAGGE